MITCQIMGGLGNQLFQIFTVLAYAMEQRHFVGFVYSEVAYSNVKVPRYTYWNSLLKNLKRCTYPTLKEESRIIREYGFRYKPLPELKPIRGKPMDKTSNNVILLYGYFQSYKYFDKYFEQLYQLLDLNQQKKEVMQKYDEYDPLDYKNTITIHFRLGDYKMLPDFHPIMPYEYYEKSMDFLQNVIQENVQEIQVRYFCEDDDLDDVLPIILKLKERYPGLLFKKSLPVLEDWEEMLLMSCCRYNIIANSSFSWWSAYLNRMEGSIVCYPLLWFGPKKRYIMNDLCPPNWCRINVWGIDGIIFDESIN